MVEGFGKMESIIWIQGYEMFGYIYISPPGVFLKNDAWLNEF